MEKRSQKLKKQLESCANCGLFSVEKNLYHKEVKRFEDEGFSMIRVISENDHFERNNLCYTISWENPTGHGFAKKLHEIAVNYK